MIVTIFFLNKQFCVTLLDANGSSRLLCRWEYLSDLAILGGNLHYVFNSEQNSNPFSSYYWGKWWRKGYTRPNNNKNKLNYQNFQWKWNRVKVGNRKVGELVLAVDSRAPEVSKSTRTGKAWALALLVAGEHELGLLVYDLLRAF